MHKYVFFFNDTATTEIYTLSLHDALPILREHRRRRLDGEHLPVRRLVRSRSCAHVDDRARIAERVEDPRGDARVGPRSEEHTSELQSRQYLVCRLLLEKKKKKVLQYKYKV